ncbi:hypothetical protein [Dawidia soli]|uniref:Import component protein n=1 Tax=Dawidia soli TaxID=2782352 RepID=A0AAP2GGP1_9BACT|nr:hypothetical protein [Dawidia soli]MBT1690754.1 hypothetical protein [Dawidia soli]
MSNKTLAILSYITIIGWLIAFVKNNDQNPKDELVTYHLKQGFGFFILAIAVNIATTIVVMIMPFLFFLNYVGLLLLVLWVFAIINAVNMQKKPIPVVGPMFENQFAFIG